MNRDKILGKKIQQVQKQRHRPWRKDRRNTKCVEKRLDLIQ